MSIADKITSIETHIGDIYDTLEVGGADLTNVNKNIVNINSQLKDRYLDYMNNGTQEIWDNWEKVTGEGTSLTLNNTEKAPIKMDLKGNTSQTGTPTPSSPIPVNVVSGNNSINIRGGKNLFDISTITPNTYLNADGTTGTSSVSNLSDYIKIEGFDFCALNYTYTSLANSNTRSYCFYNENKIRISGNAYTPFPSATPKIFNIPSNAVYIRFAYDKNCTNVTLESGDTYNIDLPVENLINLSTITENKRIGSDGSPYTDNSYDLSDYIEVQPSTTYTYSRGITGGGSYAIAYYDSTKTFISRTMPLIPTTSTSGSVTTPSNAKYARITDLKTIINQIQFEKGSKANSYTPYGTTPIELCKIGTYQDYIYKSEGNWYKYGAITKVKLSDLSWTSQTWGYQARTDLSNIVKPANTNATAILLCDVYTACSPNNAYGLSGSVDHGITMYGSNVMVRETTITSLDNFNNMIANASVYFINIEATTTQITDTTLISQLNALELATSKENQTNISQANNDLPFIISASALKEWSV